MRSYRVIGTSEEHPYERLMADLGLGYFVRELPIPESTTLRFIAPAFGGEFVVENPVLGLALGSRGIYLLTGLSDFELITTLAHEARHIFQAVTGKYCVSNNTRESDSRLYVLELNPPRTGPEIRRWLWLEQAFAEDPSLRESFARAEAVMRERQAPAKPASGSAVSPPIRLRVEYTSMRRPSARTYSMERITL